MIYSALMCARGSTLFRAKFQLLRLYFLAKFFLLSRKIRRGGRWLRAPPYLRLTERRRRRAIFAARIKHVPALPRILSFRFSLHSNCLFFRRASRVHPGTAGIFTARNRRIFRNSRDGRYIFYLHGKHIVVKIATKFCNARPYRNYGQNYYVRCYF